MLSWKFRLVVPIIGLVLAALTAFGLATQVMAAANHGMHFKSGSELQLHKAKEKGSYPEIQTPEANQIRIRFEQSGGLIGKPKTLDMKGKDFTDEELAKIRVLVSRSDFFDMPEPQLSNIPDGHNVRIYIEDEGRSRAMVFTRETAPLPLKELIKVLEKFASY